jgi:hypothetical protein
MKNYAIFSGVLAVLSALLLPQHVTADWIVSKGGYANASILLQTEQTLIYSVTVSGTTNDEIIALNAHDGSVTWRQKVTDTPRSGLFDGKTAFYFVCSDILEKRDMRTGMPIWKTPLKSIPEQVTPHKKRFGEIMQEWIDRIGPPTPRTIPLTRWGAGQTPNLFSYEAIVSGEKLFLFREASHGSGCVRYHCFSDWLMFDCKTGKRNRGGSGKLLCRSDSSLLLANDTDLYWIHKGRITDALLSKVDGKSSANRFSYRIDQGDGRSKEGFAFEGTGDSPDEVVIADFQKLKLSSFTLPTDTNYQLRCVMLQDHLLRFRQAARAGFLGPTKMSFELYDFRGKLLKQVESKSLTEEWYLTLLGVPGGRDVLFERSTGNLGLAVTIPSLQVSTIPVDNSVPLNSNEHAYVLRQMLPGLKHYYEIQGSVTLFTMTQETKQHELRVIARDGSSGQLLWEHTESVLIERTQFD